MSQPDNQGHCHALSNSLMKITTLPNEFTKLHEFFYVVNGRGFFLKFKSSVHSSTTQQYPNVIQGLILRLLLEQIQKLC